jgi:hypothetical protein
VNHNLNQKYVSTVIFDLTDEMVLADSVTPINVNSLVIDFSSYVTISGTWNLIVTYGTGPGSTISRPDTVSQSSNYQLSDTNYCVKFTAPTTNIIASLPTAVGRNGKEYVLKKIDDTVYTITVTPSGSELIDGISTYVLELQNEFVSIISDGIGWLVTSE